METRQLSKEEWKNLKTRIIPKLILKISLLSIISVVYTAFVMHCITTDISYFTNSANATDPSLSLILYGILFYALYMILMFISVKNVIKAISILRHINSDDQKAVELVTDDYSCGYSVSNAFGRLLQHKYM